MMSVIADHPVAWSALLKSSPSLLSPSSCCIFFIVAASSTTQGDRRKWRTEWEETWEKRRTWLSRWEINHQPRVDLYMCHNFIRTSGIHRKTKALRITQLSRKLEASIRNSSIFIRTSIVWLFISSLTVNNFHYFKTKTLTSTEMRKIFKNFDTIRNWNKIRDTRRYRLRASLMDTAA